MKVQQRAATLDDIPAISELRARWDTAWFGAVEESEDEVREGFARIESLERDTRMFFDGGRLVGVGLRWRTDTAAVIDPEVDPAPVCAALLPWFSATPPGHVDVLSRDERLRAALDRAGWRHLRSSFVLVRAVTPDLVLDEPSWPEGITVHGFSEDDANAVHRLIYVEAGWADVPGHPHRDFDEWRTIFVTEHTLPDQQVLARRGARLVGVAMGRTWDDGTGWISQLATARDERGRGIGRALLLEALRRRRAGGASSLGLSVQAENRGALDMYLAAGLEIDRELMQFVPG
jgi:ribosomal protein S18 acetylase RimI-like enzyme